MGNGIYRYSKALNMGTGATAPLFQLCTYNGTTNSYAGTGKGYYAWGFQFEQAAAVTPYIGPTTSSAVTITPPTGSWIAQGMGIYDDLANGHQEALLSLAAGGTSFPGRA